MVAEAASRKVVRVPDVVGHKARKAQLMIEDAGLQVDEVLYRESYEQFNSVVEQEPTPGKMIYEGAPVTLWVARRGITEHLPAIYRRSDALGSNLVRDVCFILEHMFGSLLETLDERHRFYDPYECPPEFLPWLASWTALLLDMDWPEDKQRAIVKRAVDLYRIRGTKRGLALFLRLFTGLEPIIEENIWPFRGFRVGVDARLGIDSVVLPPVELSRTFVVTMPVRFTEVTPDQVVRIHQIIQMEKPAHTHYYLRFLEEEGDVELREFFAIGVRSGIGIGDEVVDDLEDGENPETGGQ